MLSKDQLVQFFEGSKKQFDNPDFKQMLGVSFKTRGPGSPEDMINGMQKQIFESMGVQGDFGLKCLSRVQQVYGNDAFFLRQFFEHVQKEEMILDEAEMPETMYKTKYDKLNKFQEEMKAKMEGLNGLTAEQQQAALAEMYKQMIISSSAEQECCSHPAGCSHREHGGAGHAEPGAEGPGGTHAPSAVAGPLTGAAAKAAAALGPSAAEPAATMTEDEQLAFFASLRGGGPQ
ncbi:hypothetical protein HYH03_007927 [Edaphochlamys debaryana]|uniref:Uncharacterized protein n=1 Tax=Edaphochlamys debaryana TaxID=47281 RepID=A0A835Y7U0_9CHLO|nr:hypothetical protein HYH03_007927 [Edaphochlamys debaryana]|eukprot:KAG2494000.1 hypothetical protein HYH03_007927 [Edaphochlamys debaryana]